MAKPSAAGSGVCSIECASDRWWGRSSDMHGQAAWRTKAIVQRKSSNSISFLSRPPALRGPRVRPTLLTNDDRIVLPGSAANCAPAFHLNRGPDSFRIRSSSSLSSSSTFSAPCDEGHNIRTGFYATRSCSLALYISSRGSDGGRGMMPTPNSGAAAAVRDVTATLGISRLRKERVQSGASRSQRPRPRIELPLMVGLTVPDEARAPNKPRIARGLVLSTLEGHQVE